MLEAEAGPIAPAELPADWAQVPLILFGPVGHELPASWAAALPPCTILGIAAQGWFRSWGQSGLVRATRWEGAQPFLAR